MRAEIARERAALDALEILCECLSARIGADELSPRVTWHLTIAMRRREPPIFIVRGGRA